MANDVLPLDAGKSLPQPTVVLCGELLSTRQLSRDSFWVAAGLTPVRCSEDREVLFVCQRLNATALIVRQSFVEQLSASADFVQLTNFGRGTQVLVIQESEDLEASAKLLRLGCRGVLPGRVSTKILRQAVLAVIRGELWAPRRLISGLFSELLIEASSNKSQNGLTPREQLILELSVQGHKNSAIAAALCISPETVRWHKRRLYRKIGRGATPRRLQGESALAPPNIAAG